LPSLDSMEPTTTSSAVRAQPTVMPSEHEPLVMMPTKKPAASSHQPRLEPMAPIRMAAKRPPPKRKSPVFDATRAPAGEPAAAASQHSSAAMPATDPDPDSWDSDDSDEGGGAAAGAGARPVQPAPSSAPGGSSSPILHDDSNWDESSDEEVLPRGGGGGGGAARSSDAPAAAARRAAIAHLQPDRIFGPAIGNRHPKAIGGAGFEGKLRRLRCATCCTDVLRFANARWSDGGAACNGVEAVDYLFFRYYSGHSLNLERLRERLVPDTRRAAYACQCSWQSVAALKKLSEWGTPPGAEGGTGGGSAAIRWLPADE
jgi:hypothetical protein